MARYGRGTVEPENHPWASGHVDRFKDTRIGIIDSHQASRFKHLDSLLVKDLLEYNHERQILQDSPFIFDRLDCLFLAYLHIHGQV